MENLNNCGILSYQQRICYIEPGAPCLANPWLPNSVQSIKASNLLIASSNTTRLQRMILAAHGRDSVQLMQQYTPANVPHCCLHCPGAMSSRLDS